MYSAVSYCVQRKREDMSDGRCNRYTIHSRVRGSMGAKRLAEGARAGERVKLIAPRWLCNVGGSLSEVVSRAPAPPSGEREIEGFDGERRRPGPGRTRRAAALSQVSNLLAVTPWDPAWTGCSRSAPD